MINCKVINGEAVAAQNRLLVMDWEIQRVKKRKPEQATPRIKWWRLKEDDLKLQYNSGRRCWIKYDQWRAGMVGGDEHNDIESRTRGVGCDNWAEAPRR